MREADLRVWLEHPVTQALKALCRRQQAPAVALFLTGAPVDPATQGKAAAWARLEHVLSLSSDALLKDFTEALKQEQKAK